MLLVDGIDGSGKSRFAELLVRGIEDSGVPVTLLHVDDYRRPVQWVAGPDEWLIYWDEYFDLPAVESAAGELARAGNLVVLEGVFTLRLVTLTRCPLIYLEVDYPLAAERILRRDAAKGRTLEDVQHRIEARYFPAQRRYRAEYNPVERATALIDNTQPERPRLLRRNWAALPEPAVQALRSLLSEEPE